MTDNATAIPAGLIEVERELSDDELERFRAAFREAMARPQFMILGDGMRVSTSTPRSRWQAYKLEHAGTWWLGWLVRRWPVLTREVPVVKVPYFVAADSADPVP